MFLMAREMEKILRVLEENEVPLREERPTTDWDHFFRLSKDLRRCHFKIGMAPRPILPELEGRCGRGVLNLSRMKIQLKLLAASGSIDFKDLSNVEVAHIPPEVQKSIMYGTLDEDWIPLVIEAVAREQSYWDDPKRKSEMRMAPGATVSQAIAYKKRAPRALMEAWLDMWRGELRKGIVLYDKPQ